MSCGVGVTVGRSDAGYVVTALKERGAARRSGQLQVGDLVVSIDGVDVTASACALAPLVLGPEGTQLRLGFKREPRGPTRVVVLTREGKPGANEEKKRQRTTERRAQSQAALHSDDALRAASLRAPRPSSGGALGAEFSSQSLARRQSAASDASLSVGGGATQLVELLQPSSLPPPEAPPDARPQRPGSRGSGLTPDGSPHRAAHGEPSPGADTPATRARNVALLPGMNKKGSKYHPPAPRAVLDDTGTPDPAEQHGAAWAASTRRGSYFSRQGSRASLTSTVAAPPPSVRSEHASSLTPY
jgi:hypothetical protein